MDSLVFSEQMALDMDFINQQTKSIMNKLYDKKIDDMIDFHGFSLIRILCHFCRTLIDNYSDPRFQIVRTD